MQVRSAPSIAARDPRKASFVDLTAHHVARSRVRSLSRSTARAHVREAIHLTADLISLASGRAMSVARQKSLATIAIFQLEGSLSCQKSIPYQNCQI